MKPGEVRKLKIDLLLEPTTNDRPWLIAGVLFAFACVIIAAYAFLQHKGVF